MATFQDIVWGVLLSEAKDMDPRAIPEPDFSHREGEQLRDDDIDDAIMAAQDAIEPLLNLALRRWLEERPQYKWDDVQFGLEH